MGPEQLGLKGFKDNSPRYRYTDTGEFIPGDVSPVQLNLPLSEGNETKVKKSEEVPLQGQAAANPDH